jgi:hypothetical protein
MSPILGIIASQDYPRVTSSYESIATTTLGTTTASITFSSIPATFTHLQIRLIARSTRSSGISQYKLNFNSDTAGNYAGHYLFGDGAAVLVGFDGASQTYLWGNPIAANNTLANTFGPGVVDILDYTNTNKYKTIRILGGNDENGGGFVGFLSGVWMSSSAITSITIGEPYGANFAAYTSAALYGIKGA